MLKGDIKTLEIYSSSPIALIGDTLYPAAYSTPLSVKVLDDKKILLSYNYLGKQYSGTFPFDAKIKNKLGVFIIEKTNHFSDELFNRKNYNNRDYIIRLGSLDNMTDSYQTALKADRVSKAASILQISLLGPVPAKNEDFLNKLCEVYIKKGIELKNEYAVKELG